MIQRYEYLNDTDFLNSLDTLHLKEQYVKITVLDWLENPIKEMQGVTTGGNLNLDGNSAVRRTCNLSIFIYESEYAGVTNVDNLFSINKKVYLEIGILNTTEQYKQYPIIWFPQGTYVMIAPSLSHGTNGISLSMQLRDKMCLLNGECGGVIPASTQFDEYDTVDEYGNWIISKPTIEQIIREVVNHFGGEQLSKILISDIDKRIKKVMKWIGNTPLYCYQENGGSWFLTTNFDEVGENEHKTFTYGMDVGFIYSDFYCPIELIANAGDSVCTILDKIKNILGNFEYFYDIDGNFRFQEKKNYLKSIKINL